MNPAEEIECVLFESSHEAYILPKSLMHEVIYLEKTAIFLKRTGWIIGKQKYLADIIPIVSLQHKTRTLLKIMNPKLIILSIIHPNCIELMNLAILLDKEPEFFKVRRDLIHAEGTANAQGGVHVIVHHQKAILPDLAYIGQQIVDGL